MNVMVPIPDEFAARFGSEAELRQHVLEVLALDEYRAERMSRAKLRETVGLRPGAVLASLLARHGVQDVTASEDLEQDLQEIRRRFEDGDAGERKIAAADLVEHFQAFAAKHTLGGLDVTKLIREGRR